MTHGRNSISRNLLAAALLILALVVMPTSSASASTSQDGITSFGYTGLEETFTVPAGVTKLGVVAVGGRGGTGGPYFDGLGGAGGAGARVTTVIDVSPGQVLFVRVGSNGQNAGFNGPAGLGGFNGGGAGNDGIVINGGGYSGGGGGATDIRTCGTSQPLCPPPATNSLTSRIVVAGAGGAGGGATSGGTGVNGGAGGTAGASADGFGAAGQNGASGGFSGDGGGGATSSEGGAGGTSRNTVPPPPVAPAGTLGVGGAGLASGNPGAGGGGGGGLYGGGGAGSGFAGGGGGAGSSTGPAGTVYEVDSSGVPRVEIHHTTPTVITGPASAVGISSATLEGSINPQLLPTTYRFEYGRNGQFSESAPAAGDAGDGATASTVTQPIDDLALDTVYHYRLVAENANGVTYGAERTFRTAAPPPTVTPEPKADLAISLKPRRSARLRSRFAYGFTLTNHGPSNVETMTLSGTLARGLTFVGGSPECSANGRRVVCTFNDVAAGRTPWATIRVRATRRGVQRSKFTVKSNLADPGPTINTVTARTRVN